MGARKIIQTDGQIGRNRTRETSNARLGGRWILRSAGAAPRLPSEDRYVTGRHLNGTQNAAWQQMVDMVSSSGLTSAMCLAIPGRIVEIDESLTERLALVDVEGAQHMINISLLEQEPAAGDWILIHMGFALELIDTAKAEEAVPMMNRAHEDSGAEARHV